MTVTHLKGQAHALIDQLPETATWDDVLYEMAVRREIEEGLKDSAAGHVVPVEEVVKRFNLAE
jgi:predicted transcriptional regulator